jgi:2,3-bisphosphoglycerate-dependent phosphoglycerate mutase
MLPYWYDAIVADLAAGATVLVAAHGNSLRALVKHLDGMSDESVVECNIPTGVPIVYALDPQMRPAEARPLEARYLGDPEAARAKAEAVARQAG